MAEKVLMLALSPTMETGTIATWLKHEGDSVSPGDVLCEVETDKATMELESTVAGTLLKVVVGEGTDTKVGDMIAVVGEAGEDVSAVLADAGPVAQESPPVSGPDAERTPPPPASVPPPPAERASEAGGEPRALKASPLARRLAREAGLDLVGVAGTGPRGRVIKRDVEAALSPGTPTPVSPAVGVEPLAGTTTRLSKKRRIAAERLTQSKFSAPHYYLKLRVCMDAVVAARAAVNQKREGDDRVSLNAFLLKFVAQALGRNRVVNASWGGDSIVAFVRADIGLAVAVADGLLVPVVRDCGSKGILAIDADIRELVRKARAGEIQPEEYSGATFTVSNLGPFGIDEFTAIINPPGSAILALGAIRRELVVGDGDQTAIRSMMSMTLSCDHRVIDGAVGAAFLAELKAMIESPVLALL